MHPNNALCVCANVFLFLECLCLSSKLSTFLFIVTTHPSTTPSVRTFWLSRNGGGQRPSALCPVTPCAVCTSPTSRGTQQSRHASVAIYRWFHPDTLGQGGCSVSVPSFVRQEFGSHRNALQILFFRRGFCCVLHLSSELRLL